MEASLQIALWTACHCCWRNWSSTQALRSSALPVWTPWSFHSHALLRHQCSYWIDKLQVSFAPICCFYEILSRSSSHCASIRIFEVCFLCHWATAAYYFYCLVRFPRENLGIAEVQATVGSTDVASTTPQTASSVFCHWNWLRHSAPAWRGLLSVLCLAWAQGRHHLCCCCLSTGYAPSLARVSRFSIVERGLFGWDCC